MKVINLSERNSVLQNFLREIRDVDIQKDRMRFRRNIERIGEVMAIAEQGVELPDHRGADTAGEDDGRDHLR